MTHSRRYGLHVALVSTVRSSSGFPGKIESLGPSLGWTERRDTLWLFSILDISLPCQWPVSNKQRKRPSATRLWLRPRLSKQGQAQLKLRRGRAVHKRLQICVARFSAVSSQLPKRQPSRKGWDQTFARLRTLFTVGGARRSLRGAHKSDVRCSAPSRYG